MTDYCDHCCFTEDDIEHKFYRIRKPGGGWQFVDRAEYLESEDHAETMKWLDGLLFKKEPYSRPASLVFGDASEILPAPPPPSKPAPAPVNVFDANQQGWLKTKLRHWREDYMMDKKTKYRMAGGGLIAVGLLLGLFVCTMFGAYVSGKLPTNPMILYPIHFVDTAAAILGVVCILCGGSWVIDPPK